MPSTKAAETWTLGDSISTDEAILYNIPKATYDILDNSGMGLGASTASYIHNGGLFEKTGGTGASAIAPAISNTGTIEVTAATLDMQGAITGTGIGMNLRRFDAGVRLDGRGGPNGFVHWRQRHAGSHRPARLRRRDQRLRYGRSERHHRGRRPVGLFRLHGERAHREPWGSPTAQATISLTLLGDYNPADFAHQTLANGSTLITYT